MLREIILLLRAGMSCEFIARQLDIDIDDVKWLANRNYIYGGAR